MAHVACFMGYDDVDDFRAALTRSLETVQGHYARLFRARSADLTDVQGSLVFTGVEDDPETLETLRAMGFGDAVACGRRHPRLASWPHPRHASAAGARASDQADARRS